jgi:hypothetical protein
MVAVVLVLGIKLFRGTLNKWLIPLKPNGKDLIKRIQYLEFLANKSRYRNDETAINCMLGVEVLEDHQQSYEPESLSTAEQGNTSEIKGG